MEEPAIRLVDWRDDEGRLTGILQTPCSLLELEGLEFFLRRAGVGGVCSLGECISILAGDGYVLVDPDLLGLLVSDQRRLWMGRVRSVVACDIHNDSDNTGYNLRITHDGAVLEELDFARTFTGADWFLVQKTEEV